MNNEEFTELVKERINKIKAVLASKGVEYSQDDDRLYNFKRAAEIMRCSNEKALWGMAMKHLVSVQDIVETIEREQQKLWGFIVKPEDVTKALVEEKIGDMINYLIILEIMLNERFHTGSGGWDNEELEEQKCVSTPASSTATFFYYDRDQEKWIQSSYTSVFDLCSEDDDVNETQYMYADGIYKYYKILFKKDTVYEPFMYYKELI